METIINENKQYDLFKFRKIKKNILRPQCNITKAKPHNSNKEAKKELNN